MKTLKEFLNEASWSRDVEQNRGIKSAYGDEDNSQRTKDEIANAGPSERAAKEMAGSGKRELKPEFRGPKGKELIKYLEPGKFATRRKR